MRALGLGDIRIDSALNEPLSAQIDIVGATRDELAGLTAKVAAKDVFMRYGAERPEFLTSAVFKVGLDAHGRPVLNVRSAEPFSDPVVSFLVDLRWNNGELIREYSLLLDPPGFAERLSPDVRHAAAPPGAAPGSPASASAAPASSAPASTTPTKGVTTHVGQPRSAHAATGAAALTFAGGGQRYRVGPRDTLGAIVRSAGARSQSQSQRMMIAIYRTNPHAFDGNINCVLLGATIDMPTMDQVEAVDALEARNEVRAQMQAWRMDGRPSLARHSVTKSTASPTLTASAASTASPALTASPAPTASPTPAGSPTSTASAAPTSSAAPASSAAPTASSAQTQPPAAEPTQTLQNRVQSLEAELDDVHKQLASEHATIQDLQQTAANKPAVPGVSVEVMHADPAKASAPATAAAPAPTPAVASAPTPQRAGMNAMIGSLAAAVALALAGFAYVRRRGMKSETPAARYGNVEPMVNSGLVAQAPAVDHRLADTMPVEVLKSAQVESRSVDQTTAKQSPQEVAIDPEALEEALEKSYLDALAIDSLGIDDAVAKPEGVDGATPYDLESIEDTDAVTNEMVALDTVALDATEIAAAESPSGIHTTIIERQDFDPELATSTQVNASAVDYDLLDLDSTAEHIQHVQMPSQLHDHVVVSERRMNIIDVLKTAIERDPNRRDLRMKLLETYYGTASTNRRAFLDLVKQLSREDNKLTPDDWKKIMAMGREIAADDIFFADPSGDDIAHCA